VETSSFRYRAFISYSHRDEPWAKWLHRALERYQVPRRLVGRATAAGVVPSRIAPIFRDRDELPSASDLSRVVTAALEQSAALIVVCSPAAAASRWVNEEIRAFQRLGRAEHIYCAIVAGEPTATSAEQCFPEALRGLVRADGSAIEPIGADLRPGKDGRTGALLKLVAGLLGVGLDELVRREQQRRQRRLATIAAVSVAGMAFTSVLAAVALVARDEAARQRDRAEVEAATAQQTADFLVQLFEVADPSEARGNTVTAREILERGAARIDSELADQPRVRATLMHTMGRVYTGLGLYQPARELLIRARDARRDLQNGPSAEEVASANALGHVLYLKGEYELAESVYREALSAAQALFDGDDPLISEALAGIGEVLVQRGDFAAAEAQYVAALAMDRRLHGDMHADVGRSIVGLARALLFQERFIESEAAFREALAVQRQALGEDHPLVAVTLNDLGSMLYWAGQPDAAEPVFRDAAALYERILGHEHPFISGIQNNLGRLLLERGEIEAADALLSDALSIDRKFQDAGHDDVVYTLNNLGLARLALGKIEAALPLFVEGSQIAETRQHYVMLGEVSANLADAYCSLRRPREAHEALAAARAAFAAVQPDEQTYLANLSSIEGCVLVLDGRLDEAEPLLTSSYQAIAERWGSRGVFTRLAAERLARMHEARGDAAAANELRSISADEPATRR
jgi:tetratricopeptide (TPR) repeat protein